jgi:hypothetical protein
MVSHRLITLVIFVFTFWAAWRLIGCKLFGWQKPLKFFQELLGKPEKTPPKPAKQVRVLQEELADRQVELKTTQGVTAVTQDLADAESKLRTAQGDLDAAEAKRANPGGEETADDATEQDEGKEK